MSSFTNNGTSGTPSEEGDERNWSRYSMPMSRQQGEPITYGPSSSGLHWTGGLHRESRAPIHLAPNGSSSAASPDLPPFMYGGGAWLDYPHHDDARLASFPGANADGQGLNAMGVEVPPPVSESAFLTAPGAPFASQPYQSTLNWRQDPGPHWRPTPSWPHPVHTTPRHDGHSSSISPSVMMFQNPPFQSTTPSAITGPSERRFVPTGPVASSVPFSRGERWDFSNATTFRCLWTNWCTAHIAGNRSSVRNHLRYEHNFAADNQTIACTWDGCAMPMQRRSIPRHVIACHLEIKVTCPRCGEDFSRADANKKHLRACTGKKTPAVVEAIEEDEGGYF